MLCLVAGRRRQVAAAAKVGEAGWNPSGGPGQGLTLSRKDAKKDDQFEVDLEGRPLE